MNIKMRGAAMIVSIVILAVNISPHANAAPLTTECTTTTGGPCFSTPTPPTTLTPPITNPTPAASSASASISFVSALPLTANIAIGNPTTLTVNWSVGTIGRTSVQSIQGEFRTINSSGGTLLGTVTHLLSSTPAPGSTASFTELVTVPTDIAYRAYKLGQSQLGYFRKFVDSNGNSVESSVSLNIVSSTIATFGITRISLQFDNNSSVRILGIKQPLHAKAEISFNGSGLLQGIWEVADPTSTSGEPIFTPLDQVQLPLAVNQPQSLSSPALPTTIPGLYIVRLRITAPEPSFDLPVIRYFVGAAAKTGAPSLPIDVKTPQAQVLLSPDTVFSWSPTPGAQAYQIEVYAKPPEAGTSTITPPQSPATSIPNTKPVAGMLIAGNNTSLKLSSTTFSHLEHGQHYVWRVVAIGKNGAIIGKSKARAFFMP